MGNPTRRRAASSRRMCPSRTRRSVRRSPRATWRTRDWERVARPHWRRRLPHVARAPPRRHAVPVPAARPRRSSSRQRPGSHRPQRRRRLIVTRRPPHRALRVPPPFASRRRPSRCKIHPRKRAPAAYRARATIISACRARLRRRGRISTRLSSPSRRSYSRRLHGEEAQARPLRQGDRPARL